jgi:hypothetical protein
MCQTIQNQELGPDKKMKSIKIGLALFLTFTFFCCNSQKNEWQGSIEEVEGVTVIKNPEEPMYGAEVLSLEEELSIGEVERNGNHSSTIRKI